MTLRQYLEARAQKVNRIALWFFVPLFVVFMFTTVNQWFALGFAGIVLVMCVVHVIAGNTPCPRCGKPLGALGEAYYGMQVGKDPGGIRRKKLIEQIGKCPACGLWLDEKVHPWAAEAPNQS